MTRLLPHHGGQLRRIVDHFGIHGAEILEKAVMKEVYRRINERFESGDVFSYEVMFNRARSRFVSKQIMD